MNDLDIRSKAKQFILEEFLPGEDPANLTDATELITGGILDSLATLKLVAFLEENYRIVVAPSDLVPDNLNSITRIVSFVQSKQASA